MREEGVKNSKNLVNVVYGCPLTKQTHHHASNCPQTLIPTNHDIEIYEDFICASLKIFRIRKCWEDICQIRRVIIVFYS